MAYLSFIEITARKVLTDIRATAFKEQLREFAAPSRRMPLNPPLFFHFIENNTRITSSAKKNIGDIFQLGFNVLTLKMLKECFELYT
ncbi:Uncharacterised protein [Vibrio cholerae]|uniref:Uncharacterized protein n=1 Tax=Vibrio cholerae TaxID=666 RepID=A0A655RU29_VIBCL|nr:Uncharacterised protein [Vibrio cholerae]CSB89479.1 Uncharacterised protein [Vibrio cholerae]CSC42648.1 Uncharacterised protein [Vibrio cholerae]CSD29837.1 Uncharacterised protein [Vibrio cholerae]